MRLDVDLGADVSLLPVSSTRVPWEQRCDLPRWDAAGIRIGHADKAVHSAAGSTESHRASGNPGAIAPFFSPDGQWIGFLAIGKANKISVEGGAIVPLPMGDAGFTIGGASWGEDGNILVATQKGLVRIHDGGGQPETVAALANGEVALVFPQILPGGKAVLFSAYTAANPDASSIEVMTLADRHRKTVSRGGTSPGIWPRRMAQAIWSMSTRQPCSRSHSTWTSWKRVGRPCPLWTTSPSTGRWAPLNFLSPAPALWCTEKAARTRDCSRSRGWTARGRCSRCWRNRASMGVLACLRTASGWHWR